jgi:hypothetical protein
MTFSGHQKESMYVVAVFKSLRRSKDSKQEFRC